MRYEMYVDELHLMTVAPLRDHSHDYSSGNHRQMAELFSKILCISWDHFMGMFDGDMTIIVTYLDKL